MFSPAESTHSNKTPCVRVLVCVHVHAHTRAHTHTPPCVLPHISDHYIQLDRKPTDHQSGNPADALIGHQDI